MDNEVESIGNYPAHKIGAQIFQNLSDEHFSMEDFNKLDKYMYFEHIPGVYTEFIGARTQAVFYYPPGNLG